MSEELQHVVSVFAIHSKTFLTDRMVARMFLNAITSGGKRDRYLLPEIFHSLDLI